jgi:hypothetical protein
MTKGEGGTVPTLRQYQNPELFYRQIFATRLTAYQRFHRFRHDFLDLGQQGKKYLRLPKGH